MVVWWYSSNAFNLLEKNKYDLSACIVDWAKLLKFEVKTMYGDYFVINLTTRIVFVLLGGGSSFD